MYKQDLALNNLQWLIYHKTKPSLIIMGMKRYSILPKSEASPSNAI